MDQYFSGTDVNVFIGSRDVITTAWDEVLSIEWTHNYPVAPAFDYGKFQFSEVAFGVRIIEGSVMVTRSSSYVDPLLDILRPKVEGLAKTVSYEVHRTKRKVTGSSGPAQVPEFKGFDVTDEPPRGPYQLTVNINKVDLRSYKDKGQIYYDEIGYGQYVLNGVYFNRDSTQFANQTADPLIVQYTFLARGVTRR